MTPLATNFLHLRPKKPPTMFSSRAITPVCHIAVNPQDSMARMNSVPNLRAISRKREATLNAETIQPVPKDPQTSEGTAKAARDRNNNNNSNNRNKKRKRNPLRARVRSDQATRIIIIITAYYFLSSLPSLFTQMSRGPDEGGLALFLHRLSLLLYGTNYVFNGFVYAFCSKEFRAETVQLFKWS